MKLYLAAIYTSGFGRSQVAARLTEIERHHRMSVKYFLESYHYVHSPTMVKRIRADGIKIFLDSGAFSAFSQGVKIDLKKYCEYIRVNADIIDVASVLDAIGDAQGTYENQVAMEKQGIKPLPCFHYGEDPRYLEHYIANYEYITLGGMVPVPNKILTHWLDRLWDKHLTDGAGRPKLKVHGFGLTSLLLMERYPWFSVDSSSWVQAARTGGIYLPPLRALAVSTNSPAIKQQDMHLDTLAAPQRDKILDFVAAEGFDIDRLRAEYLSRFAFNVKAFTQLNEKINRENKVFIPEQGGLF